jgi:hypothetical protein
MKTILFSLFAALLIGIAIYVFGYKKTSEPYFEGLKLEKAGDNPRAFSAYISALIGMTDTRPLPSKALGMASTPENWLRDLNGYLDWLVAQSVLPHRLQVVVDAIDRTGKYEPAQNSFSEFSPQKTTIEEYGKQWNSIFYPEGKTPPAAQQRIIEKAMDTSISILKLIGNPSYQYDGKAINLLTGKCVDFTVFNNGQFSFLVTPGNYFLIITSQAKFPSGQVWKSQVNALRIAIPDTTLLFSTKLKTEIKRRP